MRDFAEGYKNGVEYATVSKIGYMCKTDFDYHLENDDVKVYDTIERLKNNQKCTDECGIVEVRITLSKVIAYEDYSNLEKTDEI